MFIFKYILQRFNIIRQRVDFIARLRPINQIEQINVITKLKLSLVLNQMIEQLFRLLVQELIKPMRLHQMRVWLGSNSAQILLDMKYISAHLSDTMMANLLEILDRLNKNRRYHKPERIKHIIHLGLLQRPAQMLINPMQISIHVEHRLVRVLK